MKRRDESSQKDIMNGVRDLGSNNMLVNSVPEKIVECNQSDWSDFGVHIK